MAEQQMTFDIALNRERGLELQIRPNPSVKATEAKLRLSRQARAIYELLQARPATTSELAGIGLQYCARINEIRHTIVHDGLMIDETQGQGGENEYQIVQLSESTFWQRVKDRGEIWKWIRV